MKRLTEFTSNITSFLEIIKGKTEEIFFLSQDMEEKGKVFKEKIFEIYKKIEELKGTLDELIDNVNEIYEYVKFLSEELANFSIFVKEKYHTFITILNSLKEIENIGNLLNNTLEEIFFASRNAEIKAFHLGEEGAGLAVVARELSKLTERIKEKAKDFYRSLLSLREYYLNMEDFSSKFMHKIEFDIPKQDFFQELFERLKENREALKSVSVSLLDFLSGLGISAKNISEFVKKFSEITQETVTISENSSLLLSLVRGIHETIEFNEEILKQLESVEKRNFPREKINILFNDFKEIIKNVTDNLNQIEENMRGWEELLKEFEDKVRLRGVEGFDLSISKIKNIFKEGFVDKISIMEKETYSITNSIKEMFSYMKDLKEVEENTREDVWEVGKKATALKSLIKDGEILSIYSLIETKRALLEDNSISENLRKLIKESEKYIKNIIELTETLRAQDLISYRKEEKIEVEEKLDLLLREIPTLEESIEKVRDLVNLIIGFENEIEDWNETNSKFFDKIYSVKKVIKDSLNAAGKEIELFFSETEKEKIFKPPEILEKSDEVLKLVLTSDPITLNPYLSEDSISNTVISKIHRSLFTLSPISTRILPGVAENFEISRDGLFYLIKLRKGVYFHNMKPLTSFEVYSSFKKALKGIYRNFFIMIEGAEDYVKGIEEEVRGFEIIDDRTIKIKLEYPYAPFISNLTLTNISITYEEDGKIYGLGPYILKEWIRGEQIVLERFDRYFYGTPYFKRIIYLINSEGGKVEDVVEGKIHYLELAPSELKKLEEKYPEYKTCLEKIPALSVHRLDLNNEKEPFNNPDVRMAICYAISAREFVDEVLEGKAIPAKGIFPPGYEFHNPELKGYNKDPEKAKELLKKAGLENGFEFTISYSRRGIYRKGVEFIKKCLSHLNIKVTFQELEWGELLEKSKGEGVQSIIIGWGADTPDPDSFVFPLFHSSERTHTRFSDKEVDRLIEKARRERDPGKRKLLYHEIEKKIIEKAPCVFLYHPLIHGLRNKKVIGILPHPIMSAEVFFAIKK